MSIFLISQVLIICIVVAMNDIHILSFRFF